MSIYPRGEEMVPGPRGLLVERHQRVGGNDGWQFWFDRHTGRIQLWYTDRLVLTLSFDVWYECKHPEIALAIAEDTYRKMDLPERPAKLYLANDLIHSVLSREEEH